MNPAKLTFVLISTLFLFGCASGAKMENMVFQGIQKEYSDELKTNLTVSEVTGGSKTNPMWSSNISNEAFNDAVKKSLINQGLFSEEGKYQLEVSIMGVEKPVIGIGMTVKTFVKYILTNTENNSVVFSETIIAAHTATMGDSLIGIKRLRLANEGAGKKNIEMLLDKLSKLKIKPNEISLLL